MAAPHATGVAALIVSMFGHMASGRVKAFLAQTANPQPCPTALPANYAEVFGVGTESGTFTPCVGGPGNNSWYGSGQVDALNAVTHASGH